MISAFWTSYCRLNIQYSILNQIQTGNPVYLKVIRQSKALTIEENLTHTMSHLLFMLKCLYTQVSLIVSVLSYTIAEN